jgi:hypothetical protein
MPYFNRALLIIPCELAPTLFCGLSPRVYGWIRSVTTIEDVRPAGNFAKPLIELASERNWTRVGVLGLDQIPFDIYKSLGGGPVDFIDVDAASVFRRLRTIRNSNSGGRLRPWRPRFSKKRSATALVSSIIVSSEIWNAVSAGPEWRT